MRRGFLTQLRGTDISMLHGAVPPPKALAESTNSLIRNHKDAPETFSRMTYARAL